MLGLKGEWRGWYIFRVKGAGEHFEDKQNGRSVSLVD